MATINNWVLGLLLTRAVKNVPQARRRFAARPDEALGLILGASLTLQKPCRRKRNP